MHCSFPLEQTKTEKAQDFSVFETAEIPNASRTNFATSMMWDTQTEISNIYDTHGNFR
jgi:hypothetical protein